MRKITIEITKGKISFTGLFIKEVVPSEVLAWLGSLEDYDEDKKRVYESE